MRPALSPEASAHRSHRVRVGAIGLVAIMVLIALASAILGSVSRERAATAPGGAKPDIVANMAAGNDADAVRGGLTEMGVAPGVKNESAAK